MRCCCPEIHGSLRGYACGIVAVALLLGNCRFLPAAAGDGGKKEAGALKTSSDASGAVRDAPSYVALVEEESRLKAEIEFLEREAENSDLAGNVRLLQDARQLDPQLQQIVAGILHRHLTPLANDVRRAEAGLKPSVEELRRDFAKVHQMLLDERRVLLETRARKSFTGQLSLLVNVDNRPLWLCGLLAIGTLLAIFLFDQRHRVRRLLWVRKKRAVALMGGLLLVLAVPLMPTLLTFLLGNQSYEALLALSEADGGDLPENDQEATKRLQDELVPLREKQQALLAKQKTTRAQRQELISAAFSGDPELAEEWAKGRDQLRSAFVSHRLQKDLSAALSTDLKELTEIGESSGSEQQLVEDNARFKRLTAGAVGSVLLLGAVTGGGLLRRVDVRRRKRTAATCPRCLHEGKLVAEPPPPGATTAGLDLAELRCTHVLSENPYEECGFTFNIQYRERVKMTFPTLGVPSAGKTHWLAMVYRELNQGHHPDNVHFERVRSRGSDDFDRYVDQILGSRMNTMATGGQELPHPVVFNFRDNDRLGCSDVLLNIFDFAGAITMARDIYDSHRQRQLRSEGFFFFLDPTYSSDKQAEALIKFREEVKLIKKLGPGQQIHVPVALCVTKLDLLVNQPYAEGGDVVETFYKDLSNIDRKARPMSLDLIQQRSDLIQGLRDVIWPNWEIEKQVRGLFGERFMFFPMTPVGLDNPGETDLSKRNIEPYGIIEPLMWLLHMNGHPVF